MKEYFEKSTWFETIINLYCFLAIFLPVSGILSNFINKSYFVFWKEFLVLIIFAILIPSIFRKFYFIPKYLQVLFYSFIVLIFLIIFNSIWIQNLALKAVFLGFRFELWWLFLFIFVYFLVIILKIENQILQNQIQNQEEMKDCKNVKPAIKKKDLDPNIELKTLTNSNKNNKINWKVWQKINKINPKQKIHLSIYLGFYLLTAVYLVSLIIGQTQLLKFFGFENNSSQISGQLCHLVDFGQNSCRLTLGFGSPNHLAGYLLLVLPVFWSDFFDIE